MLRKVQVPIDFKESSSSFMVSFHNFISAGEEDVAYLTVGILPVVMGILITELAKYPRR